MAAPRDSVLPALGRLALLFPPDRDSHEGGKSSKPASGGSPRASSTGVHKSCLGLSLRIRESSCRAEQDLTILEQHGLSRGFYITIKRLGSLGPTEGRATRHTVPGVGTPQIHTVGRIHQTRSREPRAKGCPEILNHPERAP